MNADNIPFGGADLVDYLGRWGRALGEELGTRCVSGLLPARDFAAAPEWASDEKKVVLC